MTRLQYEDALNELCTGTPLSEAAFERFTELLGLSRTFSPQAAEDMRRYCANSPFFDGYDLFRESRDPQWRHRSETEPPNARKVIHPRP